MLPSLTCDCDLCWPFRGAIEDTLLHCLHLLSMCHFTLTKHISDQVKDFWLVPLPDFHAILHCHDEILGSVFCSMLWALLCCSCAPESIHSAYQKQTNTKSSFTESGQQDEPHELPTTWWLLLLIFTVRHPPLLSTYTKQRSPRAGRE